MNAPVPTLLLDRDGYQIETVVNVGPFLHVAWILLHSDGRAVRRVADGSTLGFDRAYRKAFDAMKQHKADIEARDGGA